VVIVVTGATARVCLGQSTRKVSSDMKCCFAFLAFAVSRFSQQHGLLLKGGCLIDPKTISMHPWTWRAYDASLRDLRDYMPVTGPVAVAVGFTTAAVALLSMRANGAVPDMGAKARLARRRPASQRRLGQARDSNRHELGTMPSRENDTRGVHAVRPLAVHRNNQPVRHRLSMPLLGRIARHPPLGSACGKLKARRKAGRTYTRTLTNASLYVYKDEKE
jgi:hypothetical protein